MTDGVIAEASRHSAVILNCHFTDEFVMYGCLTTASEEDLGVRVVKLSFLELIL